MDVAPGGPGGNSAFSTDDAEAAQPAGVGRNNCFSPPTHPDDSLSEFCFRVAAVSGQEPGSTGVDTWLPSFTAFSGKAPGSTGVGACAPTFDRFDLERSEPACRARLASNSAIFN